MKLITEEINKVEFITEGKGASKKCYIQGIFLQAEQVNRNGRMYPMSIMEKEVNRYNEAFVQKGRALGELGHPDGPTVNLDRVSHKICDLHREGNNFVGKAQLLSTPMGKIASSLIKLNALLSLATGLFESFCFHRPMQFLHQTQSDVFRGKKACRLINLKK